MTTIQKAYSPPETGPGDAELWVRIRAGDHDCFAVIFDRHADAVYAHLLRRVADASEAEDLTSVVFLHAWRRRADVRLCRDSALPWLLGVANRSLANSRRGLRRYRALVARLPAPAAVADHADAVAERIDGQQEAARLRDCVAQLPPKERDVVELCVWDGLDTAAAATALRVPVGTVKSRLNRARRRLADRLTDRLTDSVTEER